MADSQDTSSESSDFFDISASDVLSSVTDIFKSSLPLFLDRPGATGPTPVYSYKTSPEAPAVNIPVVASVPVEQPHSSNNNLVLLLVIVGGVMLLSKG